MNLEVFVSVIVLEGEFSNLYMPCADCAFLHCVRSMVGRRGAILSRHLYGMP